MLCMPGDFLPGYVSTLAQLANKEINQIVVIGFESGKIHGHYNTREEFFTRLRNRKNYDEVVAFFPKELELTQEQMESLWNQRVWYFDTKSIRRVKNSYGDLMRIVYM